MSASRFQTDGVNETVDEAEAAELAKLKAMLPEEHEALERKFWKKIGPVFRQEQPGIELPYDE